MKKLIVFMFSIVLLGSCDTGFGNDVENKVNTKVEYTDVENKVNT
ncbi:MAG: hypothetical protein P8N69_02880 [Flavobacteriales bacterium]|nr:hypothetical protein [Flavobacteriales bacterium]